MSIDDRFHNLGLTLPEPMKTANLPFDLARLDGQILPNGQPVLRDRPERCANRQAHWHVHTKTIDDQAAEVCQRSDDPGATDATFGLLACST